MRVPKPSRSPRPDSSLVARSGRPRLSKVRYVACLIRLSTGEYLLQYRDENSHISNPGTISAFGGRVARKEPLIDALRREIKEELELELDEYSIQYVGYIEHFDTLKHHLVAATYYLANVEPKPDLQCNEGRAVAMTKEEAIRSPLVGSVTKEMLSRLKWIQPITAEVSGPASVSQEMTTDQRLAAIDICLAYSTYEANVYWQRNAIYLGLNSLMLGGLFAIFSNWDPLIILAFGFLGTVFNWHWLHVNRYSKYLAERWRQDARAMAREDDLLASSMLTLIGRPRIPTPEGRKPSEVMNNLTQLFRLTWIVVLVLGLTWLGIQYGSAIIAHIDKFINSL